MGEILEILTLIANGNVAGMKVIESEDEAYTSWLYLDMTDGITKVWKFDTLDNVLIAYDTVTI